MPEQAFAEKVVEAIGAPHLHIAGDEEKFVPLESFDLLLAVLEKAIEQRNSEHWINSAEDKEAFKSRIIRDMNAELLSIARGEIEKKGAT